MTWDPSIIVSGNPITTSYRVYLDDGSGNEPSIAWDSTESSLTNIATLAKLKTGHVYVVSVTAVNVLGESVHSNKLTIYTGEVPSMITDLAWSDSSTTWVEFRWALPDSNGGLSLTKFKVYVDVGQTGGTETEYEITDTFTRSFKIEALSTSALIDI